MPGKIGIRIFVAFYRAGPGKQNQLKQVNTKLSQESKAEGASECHLPGPSGKNGTCACEAPTAKDLCGPGPDPVDPSATQNYLMIGDSISIGMKSLVFKNLSASGISSQHNSGNAASANKGRHCVPSVYLNGSDATKWDIVSVQYGLHGLAHDM